MLNAFIAAAIVSALLAIAVEWREQRHPSFYLLKPLTTLFIVGIALQAPAGDLRTYLVIALLLSLLGDICLMFSGNAWFMAGLSSFLLAHLAFVPALLHGVERTALPWWSVLPVLFAIGYFVWLLPKTGPLKVAVVVYAAVLIGLLLAAIERHQALPNVASAWALAGAALFVLSDTALSVRQFNGRYRYAQPIILSTYWSAIGCIAYGLTLA